MKKLALSLLLFIFFSLPALSALAQNQGETGITVGGGVTIQNPLRANTIPELVNLVFELIIQVGTPVLVLMIMYTGLKFVLARGNSSAIKDAQKALMWTVIGAAIILGAFAISQIIRNTVEQLGPTGF